MNSTIRDNLRGKSTPELLDILIFSQDDYSTEAVLIIKEILIARGVSDDQIAECDSKFRSIIQNTQPTERKQTRITKTTKITNWIYYVAGLFLLAFISKSIRIAIVNNVKDKSIWTPTYVSKLKTGMSATLDSTFISVDADKMAGCVVDKFKKNYYTTFSSLNTDSVETITAQYAKECGSIIHPKIKWTDNFIKIVTQRIRGADWFQRVKAKYKDRLCNCVVNKLEDIYKDGVTDSITSASKDSAIIFCSKEFKNSN